MVMGASIYIHFSYYDDEQQPNKDGEQQPKKKNRPKPNKKNHLIVINDDDDDDNIITSFSLPNLGRYSFPESRFAVAGNSPRLFFIGGSQHDESEGLKLNEIRYLDLKGDEDLSWKTSPLKKEFCILSGAASSKDGNSIYGIGHSGNLYKLDPIDMNICPLRPIKNYNPVLLAVSDTDKIYLKCLSVSENKNFKRKLLLGYYDIHSGAWHTIDSHPRTLSYLGSDSGVVVVRDSYLIQFETCHPATKKFATVLCVYGLKERKWLTNPVQGLDSDDHAFPSVGSFRPDQLPIISSSLMQLGNTFDDQLKLALVWTTKDFNKNIEFFHCSKFTLNFILEGDATPSFKATHLSSVHFYPPGQPLHTRITAM